jgi:hypothetical protein
MEDDLAAQNQQFQMVPATGASAGLVNLQLFDNTWISEILWSK